MKTLDFIVFCKIYERQSLAPFSRLASQKTAKVRTKVRKEVLSKPRWDVSYWLARFGSASARLGRENFGRA
jgi:hypothetical protein